MSLGLFVASVKEFEVDFFVTMKTTIVKRVPKRCVHDKIKGNCRICNACEHGKHKRDCLVCGWNRKRCEHGAREDNCKVCNSCEHGKHIRECCICGTGCIHNRRKSMCNICVPKHKCQHGIWKQNCAECTPFDRILSGSRFCIACTSKALSGQRRRAGVRYCATCDATRPDRTEIVLRPLLKAAMNGLEPSILGRTALGGFGCDSGVRYPDALYERCDDDQTNWRCVMLETDEHSHKDRESSCEAGKLWDQCAAYKRLRGESATVMMIRFNPDSFQRGSRVSIEKRCEVVGRHTLQLLESLWRNYDPVGPHLFYYFYGQQGRHHIDYMLERPDAVSVYVYPE